MEKVEFPKWKYHATKESVVVRSKEEEESLGMEWADNPAHVKEKSDPAEPEEISEESAPKKSPKKAKA